MLSSFVCISDSRWNHGCIFFFWSRVIVHSNTQSSSHFFPLFLHFCCTFVAKFLPSQFKKINEVKTFLNYLVGQYCFDGNFRAPLMSSSSWRASRCRLERHHSDRAHEDGAEKWIVSQNSHHSGCLPNWDLNFFCCAVLLIILKLFIV